MKSTRTDKKKSKNSVRMHSKIHAINTFILDTAIHREYNMHGCERRKSPVRAMQERARHRLKASPFAPGSAFVSRNSEQFVINKSRFCRIRRVKAITTAGRVDEGDIQPSLKGDGFSFTPCPIVLSHTRHRAMEENALFEQLNRDIQAVMDRDPAVKSRLEVMLCYPGFKALRSWRRSHKLYLKGHFLLARLINTRCRKRTGIDIHPGATIGQGLFIDHGSGTVIGETAILGDNVTLYQGVTLGGTGKDTGKRHPTLGNNVTVGAGAKVLGPINIGDHVKVGAGSIVLKDVPAHCTVVGNPGRIVRQKNPDDNRVDLNHGDLPDPMLDRMESLYTRMTQLECTLRDYARHLGCENCDSVDCPNRPEKQNP